MLVEQQHLGARKRRHHQRDRLALAARKQVHAVAHAVFETQIEFGDTLAEMLAPPRAERRRQAAAFAAPGGQRQVFLDRESAATAGERILEDTRDEPGAGRRALARHVGRADRDAAAARQHVACENPEQRRLAGTVGADDRDEGAFLDSEADAVQRLLLERRALAEDDLDVFDVDHAAPPRRRRGRMSAIVTSSAVTKLRSEACRPSVSVESATWMAMR